MEGVLHPSSKNASILKVALLIRDILKALQFLNGGSVFGALHRRVNYFQMSVDNLGESILCRQA